MRRATDVFSEWADVGKDAGMEKGHAPAVAEILTAAFEEIDDLESGFAAIDAGCGNGWVVRLLSSRSDCKSAVGIDGAQSMITRAREIDSQGTYIHANLQSWTPENPVDLVHSMEVLYYLNDIPKFLEMVNTQWMKRNGIFAFGVDHYLENENCYEWSEKVGTRMAMHSEQDWRNMVENVGFEVLRMFRAASSDDRVGTLSFICRKL